MSHPSVEVSHVSKQFARKDRCDSLRDLLMTGLLRRGTRNRGRRDSFHALDDISFCVQPGECFGVIGHNGAGKSTLLKLIAGLMRPNHGSITVRGRLTALIEIGAGFHPDLTGRENIYLNAVVLGMTRADVRRKFDSIVEFSEIREFLDTPIKRYSSGMQARLGFSIAAHLEPKVMLVDEVLSVGDQAFRAKCMQRMRSFIKQGGSVLFVSHDLGTVAGLCDRTVVLTQGRETFLGPSPEAVARYHDANAATVLETGPDGRPLVTVFDLRLVDVHQNRIDIALPGERVSLILEVDFHGEMQSPSYGLYLMRMSDHLTLYETSSSRLGTHSPPVSPGGRHRIRMDFSLNVTPGEYAVGFHIRDWNARLYAMDKAYAVPVRVKGQAVSDGPAHLEPRLEVLPISTESSTETTACRVGA